jgi:LysM repeat protein
VRRPLPTVHLRALMPVIVVVGISAALLLPRPGDGTRALPPAVSVPVPQEDFRPVVIEGGRLPRPAGLESTFASSLASPVDRSITHELRNIDADIAKTVAARPAPTSPKRSALRAAARPPSGPTHVVVAGDTLWTIARRHSASLAAIQRWNTGIEAYGLVAGQRILVPGGSAMSAGPRPAAPRPAKGAGSGAPRAMTPRATTPRPAASPVGSTRTHVWPLAVRGVITTHFSGAHLGIDIAAPMGTPVRAIAAGTVVWAGWKDNGGGNVVVIQHHDGMRSTYNHTSEIDVAVGAQVAGGQTIARVGSTGWSTGPHLDVRIEMDGRFVDPLAVL